MASNVGVGASTSHAEEALAALECVSSQKEQITYALDTGNMPAKAAAYDDPGLIEQFPADLLALYQESIESAGPRPASPLWSTIVNAILAEWHPPERCQRVDAGELRPLRSKTSSTAKTVDRRADVQAEGPRMAAQ